MDLLIRAKDTDGFSLLYLDSMTLLNANVGPLLFSGTWLCLPDLARLSPVHRRLLATKPLRFRVEG